MDILFSALFVLFVSSCGRTGALLDADAGDTSNGSDHADTLIEREPECLPSPYALSELAGSQGIVLDGIPHLSQELGWIVAAAGDINGDGYDDILFSNSDIIDELFIGPKELYLIYGNPDMVGMFDLSTIDGTNGLLITGTDSIKASGVLDVDRDGFSDLLIAQPSPGPYGDPARGQAFLIFGERNLSRDSHLDLASLEGTRNVLFSGSIDGDATGQSVSQAGDVNGDEFPDLLIGAPFSGRDESYAPGVAFIVHGGPHLDRDEHIDLSVFDEALGVRLEGVKHMDAAGYNVSDAGDVNADGFDDVLISSSGLWESDGAAEAYLVYGGSSIGEEGLISLASLDEAGGIRFRNDAAVNLHYDFSGVGDVNGDNYDDIIIEANRQDSTGRLSVELYVVYGGSSIGERGILDLEILNGLDGFRVDGASEHEHWTSGAGAGDVNRDGLQDILVALTLDPGPGESAEIQLVFGSYALAPSGVLDLGVPGDFDAVRFTEHHADTTTILTFSTAGDFNSDGYDDLLFGVPFYLQDPPPSSPQGRVYLVLGGSICE